MTSRTVVAVLVALGSALPLAGIVWAVVAARNRMTVLERQQARLGELPDEVVNDVARKEGIPVGNFKFVLSAPQSIELAVLRQFKGPLWLGAAGLIVSGVAGVWSLYLPSGPDQPRPDKPRI